MQRSGVRFPSAAPNVTVHACLSGSATIQQDHRLPVAQMRNVFANRFISANLDYEPPGNVRKNFPHIVTADCDTTLSGCHVWCGDMKKNCTAAPLDPRPQIVVKNKQNIIQAIITPQALMPCRKRYCDFMVIRIMGHLITPSVTASNRN